ncbi:hypothetical protein UA08_07734 [Talaromyces atroroseus]|uniref:Uncharacterized protein n=1 Tax=Talaromyces atroroseus TaxID=1441469 RepID=A0A225A9L3_TALAT|nr:hypothetical protein UA08_07734 [Talaromyces atroroseus]OKL56740.1 hypothetical protein UA08_07734 [Talaromyces atroroseus]
MYPVHFIILLAILGGFNGVVVAFQHPPLGAKATDLALHAAHGRGRHSEHLNGNAQQGSTNGSSATVGIIVPLNSATAAVPTSSGQDTQINSSARAVQETISSTTVKNSTAASQATQTLAVGLFPSGSDEGLVPLVILTASKGEVATVTEGSETIVISELNANQATSTSSPVAAMSIIIVSTSSTVTTPPSSRNSSTSSTILATASDSKASTCLVKGSNAVVTPATTLTPTTLVTSPVSISSAVTSAAEDNEDACKCTCACPSGFIIQTTASAVVSAGVPQSASEVTSTDIATQAPPNSGISIIQAVSTNSVGETSSSETLSMTITASATTASDNAANVNMDTLALYSALTIALGG